MQKFLENVGDIDFFSAYQALPGICLPHLSILEEAHFSHGNFQRLLEAQLAKATELRNRLKEFIRKQDFRLSNQTTAKESKAWEAALEMCAGDPGIVCNEMEQDLFRRSRGRKGARVRPALAGHSATRSLIEGALKQWDREKQLFAMTTDGSLSGNSRALAVNGRRPVGSPRDSPDLMKDTPPVSVSRR